MKINAVLGLIERFKSTSPGHKMFTETAVRATRLADHSRSLEQRFSPDSPMSYLDGFDLRGHLSCAVRCENLAGLYISSHVSSHTA
ncbi:hypothetical protein RRG08_019088 [Elysia crispata]|uniref:Uncharacterized protein n=1 Tax=Elysia crispata TaxID=231223 RepID=A0AAE1A538_9GAST|nr:hypothetical protein RRG08_019088 [Elysia crispata]